RDTGRVDFLRLLVVYACVFQILLRFVAPAENFLKLRILRRAFEQDSEMIHGFLVSRHLHGQGDEPPADVSSLGFEAEDLIENEQRFQPHSRDWGELVQSEAIPRQGIGILRDIAQVVIEELGRIRVALFFLRFRRLIEQAAGTAPDLVGVKEMYTDSHYQKRKEKGN